MSEFHLVLMRPEIPQNVGNVIRLSVNCHCVLHIIRPLSFVWDEKKIKRVTMDYWEKAAIRLHDDFSAYVTTVRPARIYAFTSKATKLYTQPSYAPGAALLFGGESRGLPWEELAAEPVLMERVTIPMAFPGRSLNLANAVAVAAYEVWRQQEFANSHCK